MAKNNATSPTPGGTPSNTAENTRQHKLMAMGKDIKGANGGKKTPA